MCRRRRVGGSGERFGECCGMRLVVPFVIRGGLMGANRRLGRGLQSLFLGRPVGTACSRCGKPGGPLLGDRDPVVPVQAAHLCTEFVCAEPEV